MESTTVEPWLRGTLTDIDPVRRAVLHALQLAAEDADRWATTLSETELFAQPGGLPSVAFQLRHIARSLDRLLTYAEGNPLTDGQLSALKTELEPDGTAAEVLNEFHQAIKLAEARILAITPESFAEPRTVGRKHLPTTVAGLLIHIAEHTQRHIGQMVTTAKVVRYSGQVGVPLSSGIKQARS